MIESERLPRVPPNMRLRAPGRIAGQDVTNRERAALADAGGRGRHAAVALVAVAVVRRQVGGDGAECAESDGGDADEHLQALMIVTNRQGSETARARECGGQI